MEVYDQHFNHNEWFVLIVLISSYLTIYLIPRRFPFSTSITLICVGVYIGTLADHTISIPPFDFYDVNDKSSFEFFDFLSYVMYGPFGYLFLYLYEHFDIKGYKTMFYIVLWTLFSMLLEYVATLFGVFHYKEGYRFLYSLPIYLVIISLTLVYYQLLKTKTQQISSEK